MKNCLVILFALAVQALGQNRWASSNVWLDVFGGRAGAVLYPQYSWGMRTPAGNFSGYGFVEVAPHEPFFTNHLVIYCPPKSPLCVHTETGGAPNEQGSFHFQVGPRVNVHALVPPLGKRISHLFVAQLPSLGNARPPNTLIAGGTRQFKVASGVKASVDGYRRIFPGSRLDYGEYWFLAHPARVKPMSFGVFLLHHGRDKHLAVGVRIAP